MSGVTAILDNASRALLAEQLGVEVTDHNIANVDTPGFSRQTVDYSPPPRYPPPMGLWAWGSRSRELSGLLILLSLRN